MSTTWLSNHFDFDDMSPEDMILSRHVEVLRDYDPTTATPVAVGPTIPAVVGGDAADAEKRIMYCPIGTRLDALKLPAIFCTAGNVEVTARPGFIGHALIVRDFIRYEEWKPNDISAAWTPGLSSLVHLMRRAVASNPHLSFTPTEAQVPGYAGGPLELAKHVNFRTVDFVNLLNPDGLPTSIWDCIVEFEYLLDVSKDSGRIWSLSVNEL